MYMSLNEIQIQMHFRCCKYFSIVHFTIYTKVNKCMCGKTTFYILLKCSRDLDGFPHTSKYDTLTNEIWHQQGYDRSSLTTVLSQCSKFEQAKVWMSATFWSVLHTNLSHDFRRLESYRRLLYDTWMVVWTEFSFTFIIWKRVVNTWFSIPPFMFHRRKKSCNFEMT